MKPRFPTRQATSNCAAARRVQVTSLPLWDITDERSSQRYGTHTHGTRIQPASLQIAVAAGILFIQVPCEPIDAFEALHLAIGLCADIRCAKWCPKHSCADNGTRRDIRQPAQNPIAQRDCTHCRTSDERRSPSATNAGNFNLIVCSQAGMSSLCNTPNSMQLGCLRL